jgi:hypothetical protein
MTADEPGNGEEAEGSADGEDDETELADLDPNAEKQARKVERQLRRLQRELRE